MQQLAAVREQEQLQLTRRAEALQCDFRESIAELEHRYALQVSWDMWLGCQTTDYLRGRFVCISRVLASKGTVN